MFIQMHGDLALTAIKKRHALDFRQALQMVPRIRKGALGKAPLTELSAWGQQHPDAQGHPPPSTSSWARCRPSRIGEITTASFLMIRRGSPV